MTQRPARTPIGPTTTSWPAHLSDEQVSTQLPPATRVGLGVAGLVLVALLGVTWTDAGPAPAPPPGPSPVATNR